MQPSEISSNAKAADLVQNMHRGKHETHAAHESQLCSAALQLHAIAENLQVQISLEAIPADLFL